MRALKYEGTPAEVALGLKDNGNELVRLKRWKDAKDLYTEALGVLRKNHNAPTMKSEVSNTLGVAKTAQSNAQQEKSIEEACLINRALCNLELSMNPLTIPQQHSHPDLSQKITAPQLSTAPPPSASISATQKHSTDPPSPSYP